MKALVIALGMFAGLSACVVPGVLQTLPVSAPQFSQTPLQTLPVSAPQFSQTPLQTPPLRRQPIPAVVSGEEVELTGIYAIDEHGAHFLLRNGSRLDLTHQSGAFLQTLPAVEHRAALRIRGRLMPSRTAYADAELVPSNYYRV